MSLVRHVFRSFFRYGVLSLFSMSFVLSLYSSVCRYVCLSLVSHALVSVWGLCVSVVSYFFHCLCRYVFQYLFIYICISSVR